MEARISHLKRAFGLRRTRLRRLGGARTWVGLGIFAYKPAADDGGCRMTRTGGRPASTRTAAATPTKTSSGK
jgi:hypothetical protein